MTALFDRRVSLTVADRLFEGDRIVAGKRVDGFHISFKVTQALTAQENSAEATIDGLSATTRNGLQDFRRPQFVIEAGYADGFGAVFRGTAQVIRDARTSPGITTQINASDGAEEGKKIINKALAPGASVADVIQEIAAAMGASATKALADARSGKFDLAFKRFSNGYSMSGTTRHEMQKLTRALGIRFGIVNGELLLSKPNDTTHETAIVLDVDSGLVGSPERLIDKKRPGVLLYRARSLLQPGLKPGRRVELRSRDVLGSFRVEKTLHTGDTAGSDWYSEVIMKRVTPT